MQKSLLLSFRLPNSVGTRIMGVGITGTPRGHLACLPSPFPSELIPLPTALTQTSLDGEAHYGQTTMSWFGNRYYNHCPVSP